ncbi:UDP-3-O-(3-hydroxymyristoyl)glucosamine N-acyltransferase [Motiliproteus sp. SC1-56]|uniref:UDP-3-O-(3-hydroxymyristoyl)glucosamine N-acyltransferase n=1 Tax=Motiliproteus sp. SC1-56 TaxID=2799565 RepID=UPI001A8DB1E9|nr:UDP-3-O-(3-hydroxymyristoyl)glucosamine N-acyltransferase [Motiliproteus sp. SC1-56]
MTQAYSLGEIAAFLGATLAGDGERRVSGLQTLAAAQPDQVSFLANPKYRRELASTQAAAVILHPSQVDACPVPTLALDNPYLGYARLSAWFDPRPQAVPGIHATAVVHERAQVDASASVGPGAVIEADVRVAAGASIGPHCVLGAGSVIGRDTRLAARVTLYHGVRIGARCVIHSGAVIGADGFGFANDQGHWHKIAQIGGVVIGDDVEVGAGTTIDRGALEDTVIGDGVKLDNQIQVAHNCRIGENSAIAGCAGLAGSSKIGRRCTIGGGAGIAGHLELADDVHVSAMTLVTKSLQKPGVYSSGTGLSPHQQWKKNVVRFRQLDQLAARVAALEKSANDKSKG